MNPQSFYPVIGTEKIAVSRDFYTDHFGFDIVFEAEWYVSLKSRHNPAYERFITRDPNGLLIDVIQNIEPSGIYAKQYK
jgi:catechol 2,3-dioxygenase-like lactoylglutathione lyase family enzyme